MAIIMNSMNKQVQESTIQSQNEWNACLLFRNKQLTKEVKELRSVSAAMDCTTFQCYYFIGSKSQATTETEVGFVTVR